MSIDPSPIRILAVDDHLLIRVGIATLVGPEADMKLKGRLCAIRGGKRECYGVNSMMVRGSIAL